MSGGVQLPGMRNRIDARTGDRIWKLRTEQKLTTAVIAERFGLYHQTVATYIRNRGRREKEL